MNPCALLLAVLCLPLAAQPVQRRILPGRPGPQRLEVDPGLLAASRASLADLRLRDGAGREVPYVLVPPGTGANPWVAARLLPLPATKVSSGVELDLGGVVRSSRLRLEGLRPPFLKRFSLEGSGDRQRWTSLVPAGTLFDLPQESFRLLEVTFPEGDYRYLRLTWDDRSSAPLPAPRAALLLKAGAAPVLATAAIPFLRRPSEPGVSRFTLSLPGPRLPVRALVLSVAGDGPLLRDAEIAEPRLAQGGLAPRVLGSARLRRAVRDGAAAYDLRIPITAPEGPELDLRVQDGNNPALALSGARVELEPQPWIYFETTDPAPLTATCGDPALAAPRYDLEALKDRLPGNVALATWDPEVPQAPAPAQAAPLGPGPGAPLDRSGFRFSRALPAGAPGLVALALDAHVLASSPELRDLRLLDQAGCQIPYLLEARGEPLSLDLPWPRGATREHTTAYRLRLPQAGLPASKLVLETGSRVFRRRVRVLAGNPAEVCSLADWSHGDPGTAAPALLLVLPASAGQDVTVEVEEGDNPPLPIGSARLLLPSWRLRFFRPGEGFSLLYGRDLAPPAYDLALLAERLRNTPAGELALGPEGAPSAAAPGAWMVRAFWGSLVLAVAGLLLLLVKVLGKD